MKFIAVAKRRYKQQFLQTVRLAKGLEDTDFSEQCTEFRAVVNSIRHFQGTARSQAQATKRHYQNLTAAAVELAAFHRGTHSEDGARALAQALADLERVQLAAFDRLFEEEVVAAVDLLLWRVPEIEERIKQRGDLLLDYNSYCRKYERAEADLAEFQQKGYISRAYMRLSKTESELAADVATRKVKLEHAEAAFNEATQWCLTQFQELRDQRESGLILGGAMAAFFACQRMLMNAGSQKLERVRQFIPAAQKHDETLALYEADFANLQAANGTDLFAGFGGGANITAALNGANDEFGPIFGGYLPEDCPYVVIEAIDFLEAHGGLETEGLFRMSGNQEVVNELRDRYNAGELNVLEEAECDVHDAATLLKRYLQELPESLVPQAFYQRFIQAAKARDECDSLSDVVGELPEAHMKCLFPLLRFLYKVARRSDINKMTFNNLATCLAPTVIKAPQNESPIMFLEDMSHVIAGFKTLIEHAKRFDMSNASVSTPRQAENRPPLPPMSQNRTPVSNKRMSVKPAPVSESKAQGSSRGMSLRRMSMRRSNSSSALQSQLF